jgi:Protein of unknown function (DUF664)
MMTFQDTQTALPIAGAESDTLLGALDRNRRTFAWKCFGLPDEDMQRTLGPSTLTLAGLVKHMALVEDHHFTLQFEATMPEPWASVDWDAEPEYPWTSASADSPAELKALWEASVVRSRELLGRSDLDQLAKYCEWDEHPNLRRVVVDMIEEYARHTGHADLIRESIDGLVGEDAPRD